MSKTKNEFTCTIKLGNAAMLTGRDVAEALRKLAGLVEEYNAGNIIAGSIRDTNGNVVGRYSLSLPTE
jgi:hypothetical protein